ncbi:hypothetical protein M513_07643, partial [Trichuris suis]
MTQLLAQHSAEQMTIGVSAHLVFSLTLIAASLRPTNGQEDTVNLYAHAKSIESLNASTFDDAIFRKNVASIVMLYSSSCGACVGFAPKWVNFAESVKGWKRYAKVAAINCNSQQNDPICMQNKVTAYPTIRFYGYQSTGPDDGVTLRDIGHSNSHLLPLVFAKHILNDWNRKKPAEWPNFGFVPTFEMIPDFLSPWAPFMAIIVQTSEDSIGAAITLDMSNQYSVETRIMDYLHPFAMQRGMSSSTQVPALIIKRRDTHELLFVSTEPMNRNSILDIISRTTNTPNPLDAIETVNLFQSQANRSCNLPICYVYYTEELTYRLTRENADPNKIFVHVSDVKSGLAYMLRYEVPMHERIDGEAKVALHQFLNSLAKYLPLERSLRYMLDELAAFVGRSPGSLTADDWRRKYDNLQRAYHYPLPNETTWVGCKGSESRYRGYPCSVWMIFHLLTVQAYIHDGHLSNFDPLQVPWSIYGYVKHFFGCRFCANNFVAFLIFFFFFGHVTEDPEFPKNQFPYKEICGSCFNSDGSYNEAAVFSFLLRFYSDIKTFDPQVADKEHFELPFRPRSCSVLETRKDLFGSEDDVVVINQENFDQTIYGKPNIWFVLFYSSYCGHCVNFAPTWQEVASSVAEWSTVVRVAALNCALDENFAKCQEHSIEGYPMLKMFLPQSSEASAGKEISLSQRTANSLTSVLAYEAGVYYRQHHPQGWPDLGYIAHDETAMLLLKKNKQARYVVMLFQVPDDKAALGEQLVLRYANFSETLLVHLASPEHVQVRAEHLAIPALVIADRRDMKVLYKSKHPVNLVTAMEAIRVHCLIGPIDSKRRNVTKAKLHNFVAPKEELRSEDLQSALSYLLQHEVPIRETIFGRKFVAIKNLIELLNQYYPSDNRNVRLALRSLLSWLQMHTGGISSKDWLEQIKTMKELYSFPTTVQWVTCRGSDIQYRGYPCGLWMLFHTITVRAFQADGHKEGFDAKAILNAINAYVQEFFGCRECAKNFGKAAVKIDAEVTQPHDVVMWLWKSHNRANNFLKGTLTDDPSHPKAQFPTEKLCPKCRNVNGEWVLPEVLAFLTTFYGQKRIREDDQINPKFKPVPANNDDLFGKSKGSSANWFSKHPFSVCFFVWVVCSSANLPHHTVAICAGLVRAARMKVGHIGGRIFRHLTTQADALTTEQSICINERSYVRDSWTNLPRSIFNLFGRDLLQASDSPLRLIKLRIVDYFNEHFKNSSSKPLFPLFDFFDPVVSIRQNFDSLLVPADHVCRLPSDTYYVNKDYVLRTHTSAHQSELIKSGLHSFIVAGDVYRRDEIDRSHYPCFHQMEGVHLFTDFSLFGSDKFRGEGPFPQLFHNGDRCPSRQNSHTPACAEAVERHLKGTLEGLMRHLFADEGLQLRWTSSYFPFTHPSWELEIFHNQNWMEMLGCGIIEQKILENAGAGDRVGWAFGLGLERLAMRLFEIPDIRLFWTKDTGFTSQFKVEDYRTPIVYKAISRYPQCVNDIAFWLPHEGPFVKNDFYDLVRAVGGDIVEQVNLLDEYVHPKSGRKSNCFRIAYRHMERTLTQNEANKIHKAIEDAARDQFGVVIRMSTLLRAKAGRLHRILSMTTYPSTYNVFDRDLKRRQRDWAASQDDFKDYEYLRKEIGYRLSDRIYDVKRVFNVAVDLGCGCGYIAPHVYKEHVDTLIQLDMSRVMVKRSASSEEVFTARLHADEELVPFRDDSIDLVLSSLSLHWINDLPGTFKRIFNVLRPDGLFLAATFGGNTLYELRCSLQLAETERLGGLAPHLSPLLLADDVTALLSQSGFKLLTIDVDTIVVNYPNMFALLYDLQGMAESSATWLRAECLRRDVLYAASAIYKEMYAKDDCYPATFQIFYLTVPAQMAEEPLTDSVADVVKSSRLIVKNLPKYITSERLKRLFDRYGVVTDCQLKYSADGRFRGFAFVGFLTVESAESAVTSLNGTFVDTARIHIDYCQRFYPSSREVKTSGDNKRAAKPNSANTVCIESNGVLKRKEVLIFLAPTKPAKLTLSADGKTATVVLRRRSDLEAILKLDGQFLGGNRLHLTECQSNNASSNTDRKGQRPQFPPEDVQKQANAIADSGALFVRNLAYQCAESDLRSLFEPFGPIANIDYPTDSSSGKPKGFGTVRFVFPENALKAFSECDGIIFQGRVLHILANAEKEDEPMVDPTETSDYKDEKKLKQKQSQSDSRTWNTLFLGPNAVVDVLADRLDVEKREILDPTSSSSLGVRVALGEAQIVRETVQFLEQHGVVLDSFQGTTGTRSDHVILVKNIPAGTTVAELGDLFKKYGRLGRIVRPPHGLCAIVEFLDGKRAKSAFNDLAFKRFKHKPLYLEWAPASVFSTQYDSLEAKEGEEEEDRKEKEEEEPNDIYQQCTVFVKNLNAQTNDQRLADHFKKMGTVVSASVVKKYAKSEAGKGKPADQFSLCYGFVTYKKPEEAREALKQLQGSRLDGNELEIQISQRPAGPKEARRAAGATSKGSHSETTILVRNIPFQANRKEIQQVFKVFGPLKVVRMPRKASSAQHRGFGFVEYASKLDAEKAMAALGGSTHLYGRRLVLEWADTVGDLDELRKRTADYFAAGPTRLQVRNWQSSDRHCHRFSTMAPFDPWRSIVVAHSGFTFAFRRSAVTALVLQLVCSVTPLACVMLFLLYVIVGLLVGWPSKADRPFVKVICSDWSIEATVGVDAQFSGQVVAEPKDNESNTRCLGVRTSAETFTLNLSAVHSPICIQTTNSEMTTKLVVRRLWWVETVEDLIFTITCPTTNCSSSNDRKLSNLPEVHMQIDSFEEGVVLAEPNQWLTAVALYPRGSAVTFSHCHLYSVDIPGERLDLIDEYGCAINSSIMPPFQSSRANGIAEATLVARTINRSHLMMLQCAARTDSNDEGSSCLRNGWREPAEPLCRYTLNGLVLSINEGGPLATVKHNVLQCIWDVRLWPSIMLSLLFVGLLLCDLAMLVLLIRNVASGNRKNSRVNLLSSENWPSCAPAKVSMSTSSKCTPHSVDANGSSGISSYYSTTTVATGKLKEKNDNSTTADRTAIYNVAQVITSLRRVRIVGKDYCDQDENGDENQSAENLYEIPNCVISGDAKKPILSFSFALKLDIATDTHHHFIHVIAVNVGEAINMISIARLVSRRNAYFLLGSQRCAKSLLPNKGIRSSTAVRQCAIAKRLYTDKHEWVLINGQVGTVGISDYAQGALGELVYVQLPEVGTNLKQFAESCVVESVKAASDVYSPVSGTVTEVNNTLEETPSLVNKSCLDNGWLYKLKLSEPAELEKLLDETNEMWADSIFQDIYEKRVLKVKEKIEADEQLAQLKDSSGRNAFHWACSCDLMGLVEFLLPRTKNVNETDDLGWTPLMTACSAGHKAVVDFLIANGASTTIANNNGQTALHYAASKNHTDIVCTLLEHGAYAGAKDKLGATALHRAASKGNSGVVEKLLANKDCLLNTADSEGNTALHLACDEDRRQIAVMLVKAGASVDLKNKAVFVSSLGRYQLFFPDVPKFATFLFHSFLRVRKDNFEKLSRLSTMSFAVKKLTTGLTGIHVVKDPAKHLRIIYGRVLKSLQKMPEDCEYRRSTEATVIDRLQIIEAEPDPEKLEEKFGLGQLEEVILQAELELNLTKTMLKYAPWEPLIAKPADNQWTWPI